MSRYLQQIDLCLCLIKDGDALIGFSLTAGPQTEAEYFCALFPKGLQEKTASITIKGNNITFEHSTKGTCMFELNAEDAKTLNRMLNGSGEYKNEILGMYKDGLLTPGFKIVLAGMQNSGTKQKPIYPLRQR